MLVEHDSHRVNYAEEVYSLTRFAEDKDTAPARIQADSMVFSEVEILKSSRLARAVVVAAKLNENKAFLYPPLSPFAWLKDHVGAITRIFSSAPAEQARREDPKIKRAIGLLQSALTAERIGRSFVIEVSLSA